MLEILRGFWSEGTVEYHGKHFDFPRVQISPAPMRNLPVWIGAAMVAGVLLGRLVPDLNATLERIKVDTVSLPIAIGLMAMMGPGLLNIVLALAYKEWVIPCRVVRGETLAVRELEYVEAARALGAT